MRKHFFPQLPFWAKVGRIPTSYRVAMSYEEQLLWLCKHVEDLDETYKEEIELALKEMEDEFYRLLQSVEEKKDLSSQFIDDYGIDDDYLEGSVVDLTPSSWENACYAIIPVSSNKNYEITGQRQSMYPRFSFMGFY